VQTVNEIQEYEQEVDNVASVSSRSSIYDRTTLVPVVCSVVDLDEFTGKTA
jgi:hypothetical protein